MPWLFRWSPFYNTGEISLKLPLDACELQKSKNKEWKIKLLIAVMSTKTSIHGFFMFFVSVSKLCFGCWASKIRLTKKKRKNRKAYPENMKCTSRWCVQNCQRLRKLIRNWPYSTEKRTQSSEVDQKKRLKW